MKYPGSKWNLARDLAKLIPEHHTYCEPYAGSMAMLFTKDPSPIEVVNDLDSDVVNLFQCIQQDSERLARLVMTTPYSREVYDSQFKDGGYASRYQRAAGFLVKCWQGHGFRTTGGKVGWKNDVQGRERALCAVELVQASGLDNRSGRASENGTDRTPPSAGGIQRFNFPNAFPISLIRLIFWGPGQRGNTPTR